MPVKVSAKNETRKKGIYVMLCLEIFRSNESTSNKWTSVVPGVFLEAIRHQIMSRF